jgi:predicted SAM-dependent methyltransferase
MDLLHNLNKHDLVKGLPKTKFVKDKICDGCQLGKQHKTSFPKKKYISTSRPLQLLHMDLFGPNRVASLGEKLYAFVIVDIFHVLHGYYFLLTKMRHTLHLQNLVRRHKMK